MARTVLHLGAHKTATSFIQKSLALNLDALAEHGVCFLPLDILRKNFTAFLHGTEQTDITRELLAAIGRQTVLISDENISGAPADLIRHGTYYQSIGKRTEHAMNYIRAPKAEIFFALRDYASFNVSMYCEFLRHKDYMPFAEYDAAFRKSGFSWVKVVDELVAAAPQSTITLWDYANFRQKRDDILSAMTGFDASGFKTPDNQVRESLSQQTVQSLEKLATFLPPSEVRRAVGPLTRAFPKSDGYTGFDPVQAAEKANLAERYANDLAMIRRKYPQIRLL